MNREIKFRFWDSDFNEMIYIDDFYFFEEHGIHNSNDIQLMQFTGFHDKNGKEIYEGDILKNEYSEINTVEWKWGKWHETVGQGEIGAIMNSGFRISSHGNKHEIIGNIYETNQQ